MPDEVMAMLDAIGNTARTEILRYLSVESLSASDLAEAIGVDHSRVLRHLTVLEDIGLVWADHPRGSRRGVGRLVKWQTDKDRVKELANAWRSYASGQQRPAQG